MRILAFFIILCQITFLSAQLNRYPYIQSTTQTSTIIAWKTANNEIGKVAFGLNANNLTDTLYESSAVKRHAFTLRNLQKDTKYFYAIYSGNTLLASEYFSTASDSTDQEFSFLQYGDCGYNSSVQATIGSLMEADQHDFAVVCGDIDQGGIPHISSGSGGDDYDEIFFDVYNNGTSNKMLSHECHYTAIGNHDVYANNGATYELEFHLPHNNIDSSERYYSFEWGDAKFIALDVITPFDPTTFPINQLPNSQRWWTDFRQGSAQYQFLEDELRCNDKKWVFVYFHEGPWTNYWGADYNIPSAVGGDYYQYEGNLMVRQHLVPLFEQYGVDFVLVGHSHLYEQAEKNGVMYITSGGAGDVGGNTQYANHPEILKSIIDNMFIKFHVDSNTVSYDVINDNNTIIDTFSLTKSYQEYRVTPLITNVTCNGGSDGSVALNIQGPKAPYSVEWFNGTLGDTLSNLSKGSYYAYVRNAYGCEKVISIEIDEPPVLAVSINSLSMDFSFCNGDSVLLFTDNPNAYHLWNNGSTDSIIYSNQEENVSVQIIDSNLCIGNSTSIQTREISDPIAFFGYANNGADFNFLCPDLNVDSYHWDFGDGTGATAPINLANHFYTANGSYDVSLMTINGCDTDTYTLTITVNNYPTSIADLYVKNALQVVPNPFNSSAQVSVTGLGENQLTVEMYNLIGVLSYVEYNANSVFTIAKDQMAAGTYYLKVSNKKGEYSYSKVMIN